MNGRYARAALAYAYLEATYRDGFTTVAGGNALRAWRWTTLKSEFAEGYTLVDNLTDRNYAGSVIVNEANRRF